MRSIKQIASHRQQVGGGANRRLGFGNATT